MGNSNITRLIGGELATGNYPSSLSHIYHITNSLNSCPFSPTAIQATVEDSGVYGLKGKPNLQFCKINFAGAHLIFLLSVAVGVAAVRAYSGLKVKVYCQEKLRHEFMTGISCKKELKW